MVAQLTGAAGRSVTWPAFTGPQRPGRPQNFVPSRWPLHGPGATLDYAVDLTAWLTGVDGTADAIGGLAGGVARADGTPLGGGDMAMVWLRASGSLVVACLQGGLPSVDYTVLLAVGTVAGRLQPVVVSVETSDLTVPALLGTPIPGAPWPPIAASTPATAGSLGGVVVPAGSGLAVDGSGNLSLSAVGLPTSAAGLPVGALWNDGGLISVVTIY